MKLSELKTGQTGIILKVQGHGGFRKRIVEMGFVKGKTVEVLLNAPLRDPVVYKVMGYEVSLRRQEADLIEVSTAESDTQHEALRQRRIVNVALIGNPNCGKTSLFNYASGAHGRVGNYSGVTVGATQAHATMFGYEFNLIDLNKLLSIE